MALQAKLPLPGAPALRCAQSWSGKLHGEVGGEKLTPLCFSGLELGQDLAGTRHCATQWETPAGARCCVILGMVQALVGAIQPRALWASASAPWRTMFWWRHDFR